MFFAEHYHSVANVCVDGDTIRRYSGCSEYSVCSVKGGYVSKAISSVKQPNIEQLYEALRSGDAQLMSGNGKTQQLPESIHQFLTKMSALLSEGKSIHIVQDQAELTTVEAAAILGVSRQFLVNLLERHEIPHHLVGTHRRVYASDVFLYKARRDSARKAALRELVKSEAADGLYTRRADGV